MMYYNQQSIHLFLARYDSQLVRTVFAVNLCYVQESISYVQGRFKLNEINRG